jgi:hypothetical protein
MFDLEQPCYVEVLPQKLLLLGGGSSSGGGSSGTIDYPAYMKGWHDNMLYNTNTLVNTAMVVPQTFMFDPKIWFGSPAPGTSPFTALAAFTAFDTKILFKDLIGDSDAARYVLGESAVTAIKNKADTLRALIADSAAFEAKGEAMIDAHSTKLLQKINTDVMPKVEVGMRDLNAVVGTSFVIARELVMEDYMHEVAAFAANVRMRILELQQDLYKFIENAWVQAAVHAAELGMKRVALDLERLRHQVSITTELANLAVLAQSKYAVVQTEEAVRSKTWNLDMYNRMNAAMASISGSHTVSSQSPHSATSVFSGVLGGGAMGAGIGSFLGSGSTIGGLAGGATAGGELGMAGGPAGALIGAVLGAGAGLLSGLFSRK